MNYPKGGEPKQKGGNRRRSVSESEAIESTTSPTIPNGPNGDLSFSTSLKIFQGGSYPNLSSSGQGFISTPINEGANTRLGAKRLPERVSDRTIEDYQALKLQIQQWMTLISGDHQTDKPDIERVAQTFITRINNLAQNCLIKKIDFKIYAEVLQLLPVVKKARRTHLRISGIQDDIDYEESQDEDDDEIFLSQSNNKQEKKPKEPENPPDGRTIEPEKEKHLQLNNTDELTALDEEEANILEKLKQSKRQQALATTRSAKDVSDESMFNGFNTVIDEIEEIKAMIERNKKLAETREWKREKKLSNITTEIKKLERSINSITNSVDALNCSTEANIVRVGILEEKQYNLSLTVKRVEKRVLKRISELAELVETNFEDQDNQSTPIKTGTNIKRADKFISV